MRNYNEFLRLTDKDTLDHAYELIGPLLLGMSNDVSNSNATKAVMLEVLDSAFFEVTLIGEAEEAKKPHPRDCISKRIMTLQKDFKAKAIRQEIAILEDAKVAKARLNFLTDYLKKGI